ncbi:MAG: DUF2339 domain-containing protein [Planctomycetota bacterium]|jgi:uncharacterized membrane protein
MSGITGLVALVVSIAALAILKGCRNAIRKHEDRINGLAREIHRLKESSDLAVEETPSQPPEEVPEKVVSAPVQELRREVSVTEQADVPAHPASEEVPEVSAAPTAEALRAVAEPKTPEIVPPPEPERRQPLEAAKSLFQSIDRERWATLEAKLGKQWMTWVGAIVLFLSAGFFVKYAFEHQWLGEGARVILGVVAGIGVAVAGERFVRRKMRALGQGLIGTGLAILYVSLYAAYGFYGLLPQSITFVLMALVTTGGMVLAVIHDAVAVSFLAVLGGLLTPLMLRTGRDPRDSLFAYLLLLDLGVLGVAFFKRWRVLDVLAFIGTWALFPGWYFKFRHAPTYSIAPTVLWLATFYVVFLIQPFVYHLRLATPIVGERFFLAVSNAAGMFGLTYTILHSAHKHALGLITLGMSASYLVLGSLTKKRLRCDERAVFGFIALSVMFLTIAIPIHLDFHGVTVAWAVKAPILLYLAYKYSYFPVRAGVLITLALAAGRIFTIHWPLHEKAFTPIVNQHFGTAIFVALAGGAYTFIHHLQRKNSSPIDHVLKVWTGIASAFLALVVINIEVWQWLDLSGRDHLACWACALVCAAGAAGFLVAGIKLRCVHSRFSGLVALAAVGTLEIWDYCLGIHASYPLIFNGRFFAAFAAIMVIFSYAFTYRRLQQLCNPNEKRLSIPFYGAGIGLLVILFSCETWQWLALRDHHYIARCLLPLLWIAGTAGYFGAGVRLRSIHLRQAGLAVLAVAGILAGVGYAYRIESDCLLCLNGRFAAALAVPLMAFMYAFTLRRLRDLCEPVEQYISEALYGIGIFLLVILTTAEIWLWLDARSYHYLARCLVPLLWVAGTAAYLGTGIKLRTARLRNVGLAVLAVAGIFASRGYAFDMDAGYLLYLSGRLLAGLTVVLMVFAHGFALRRFRDLCQKDEQLTAKILYGVGIALLFALLSGETYLYFRGTIADPERARWVSQMSLSVTWGAYAIAMLAIGFWRKVRSLRLTALGLFGLTALKLVLIDMAKVQEVYRIVSFLVLGVLMIGASYLYHRVEKQLSMSSASRDSQRSGN